MSIVENVYWKEFGLIFFVWVVFLGLQISKVGFVPKTLELVVMQLFELNLLVVLVTESYNNMLNSVLGGESVAGRKLGR